MEIINVLQIILGLICFRIAPFFSLSYIAHYFDYPIIAMILFILGIVHMVSKLIIVFNK